MASTSIKLKVSHSRTYSAMAHFTILRAQSVLVILEKYQLVKSKIRIQPLEILIAEFLVQPQIGPTL